MEKPKPRIRSSGLVPLGELRPARWMGANPESAIRAAWPELLGPGLASKTRFIRWHQGVLFLGTWHTGLVPGFRESVKAVLPELQARFKDRLKLRLVRVEVLPCDPDTSPIPEGPGPLENPLQSVLEWFREHRR